MDPIQPIERHSPWISELAAEQAQGVSRERRKPASDRSSRRVERKQQPRRQPVSDRSRGDQAPDEDRPEGRHIDVHA
jgi:hypothetical protein